MGMFDTLRVKVPLPIPDDLKREGFDWNSEDYQTKDLENCLGLYEISPEGRLMYLDQQRAWVPDDEDFLGGHFKVETENWKDTHFHGNLTFYTSYCEKPEFRWDYGKGSSQMSWNDILELEGFDWWIEFEAVFDSGKLREIKVKKTEKTPIRVRLGSSKEWDERRERESRQFPACLALKLKRIPGWNKFVRGSCRLEQKIHEKVSRFLMKLS